MADLYPFKSFAFVIELPIAVLKRHILTHRPFYRLCFAARTFFFLLKFLGRIHTVLIVE